MENKLNRRNFLKLAGIAGIVSLLDDPIPALAEKKRQNPDQLLGENIRHIASEIGLVDETVQQGALTTETDFEQVRVKLMDQIHFTPKSLSAYLVNEYRETNPPPIATLTIDTGVKENSNLPTNYFTGLGPEPFVDYYEFAGGHGTLMAQAWNGLGIQEAICAGSGLFGEICKLFTNVINGFAQLRDEDMNIADIAEFNAISIASPLVRVTHSSLASIFLDYMTPEAEKNFMTGMRETGNIIIFSAGNRGREDGAVTGNARFAHDFFRGDDIKRCMTVGALDEKGQPSDYSSYQRVKYDQDGKGVPDGMCENIIYVPGHLPVLDTKNNPGVIHGTSPAAAIVANLANMLQLINPNLTGVQIGEIIMATSDTIQVTDPLFQKRYGNEINAANFDRAIEKAKVSNRLYIPQASS